MIYVWRTLSDEYPEKYIGEYDRKNSPDRFLLKQGKVFDKNEFSRPLIHFDMTKKQAEAWDVLASNAMVPLVSQKLAIYLMQLAPNDMQLIPAIIQTKDERITDYQFVNVLNKVTGIDKSVSIIDFMKNEPHILGFRYLKYHDDCLGKHLFARDAEYSSNLLVADVAMENIKQQSFTGLGIYDPETIIW